MWRIEEHRRTDKQVAKAPSEILKRYEKWKDIATVSGPPGLRSSKDFMMKPCRENGGDFALPVSATNGVSFIASFPDEFLFQVASITPHDYETK